MNQTIAQVNIPLLEDLDARLREFVREEETDEFAVRRRKADAAAPVDVTAASQARVRCTNLNSPPTMRLHMRPVCSCVDSHAYTGLKLKAVHFTFLHAPLSAANH